MQPEGKKEGKEGGERKRGEMVYFYGKSRQNKTKQKQTKKINKINKKNLFVKSEIFR